MRINFKGGDVKMSDCTYDLLPAQRKFYEIDHNYGTDIALYQGGFGS